MYLPNVAGLHLWQAALRYVENGIPVAPFDPTKGKGKSCWNLAPYQAVSTNKAQLWAWRNQFGDFKAIATSPGEFGCVVIDVDKPRSCPRHLRSVLAKAPYINTRPSESPNRGHYWFLLPQGLQMGNPSLGFGEVRCVGGGIVLPPCGERVVVREGMPQPLAGELLDFLGEKAFIGGAGAVTGVQQFIDEHRENKRPHKLPALLGLHETLLDRGYNLHDAMRRVLLDGLGEASIGYVPARDVVAALRDRWTQSGRERNEFTRLVEWSVSVVASSDREAIKLKSDRFRGSDSRDYARKAGK